MVEEDGAEERVEEVEAPPEEGDTEEAALYHFGRYSDMRRAVPWEQRSTSEKVGYYLDRGFMVFIVLFLMVLFGECVYKFWYVTNVDKIMEFVSDIVSWLFTQDKDEELDEL